MTTPQQYPLSESDSVTLDGSGNGTLSMKPWAGSVTWQPSLVAVKCSRPITNEAEALYYIGPTASDQYFIDGTLSGSTGDSSTNVTGRPIDTHGNTLWVVWTGGDAGAQATAQVTGTYTGP